MKLFACQVCEQLLYFENVLCERCGHTLGYLPQREQISALEPREGGVFHALADETQVYRFCKNQQFGVCNWLVPANVEEQFCAACRHNRTIPDLADPQSAGRWRQLEAAKHRLFYTLMQLRLPLHSRSDDPEHGLVFDFLAEAPESHSARVMTGHDNGVITLAVAEADDAERERVRADMGEPYRTLLGHFRHESGHYFWDVLVRDRNALDSFRAAFGDETQDYAAALSTHYASGAPPDWQQNFVSAYASSHPWEDFAETWAHYLHIVDTLETARAFGLSVKARTGGDVIAAKIDFKPHKETMGNLIDAWLPIAFASNSLNRSMGHADLYPFVLSPPAIAKLTYVRDLIHGGAHA